MPKFLTFGIIIIAALVSREALADDSEPSISEDSPTRNESAKMTWAELAEIESAKSKANKTKFDKPCSYFYSQVEQSKKRLRTLTASFEHNKNEGTMQRMQTERGILEAAIDTAEECVESSQPSSEHIAKLPNRHFQERLCSQARICAS